MRRLNFGRYHFMAKSHIFQFNRSTLSSTSTAPLTGEDCYSSDTTSGGFSSASSYEECDSEVGLLVLLSTNFCKCVQIK